MNNVTDQLTTLYINKKKLNAKIDKLKIQSLKLDVDIDILTEKFVRENRIHTPRLKRWSDVSRFGEVYILSTISISNTYRDSEPLDYKIAFFDKKYFNYIGIKELTWIDSGYGPDIYYNEYHHTFKEISFDDVVIKLKSIVC